MRKLAVLIMSAGIMTAILCGCNEQTTTQKETAGAEATTQEATTEETTEVAIDADDDTEVVTESTTTVENDVFKISYPTDLFEKSDGDDAEYYDYAGEAAHSVYLEIAYHEDDPDTLAESARGVDGMTIVSEEEMTPSFWDEDILCIEETSDEDGYTATYSLYFMPYLDGTLTIAAVSYEEPDEATAMEISDAMENLINSIEIYKQ